MKYIHNILLIIGLLVLFNGSIFSLDIPESETALLKSGNSGTEFLFSIPPSYNESGQTPVVKVLVSSTYVTDVNIEIPASNYSQTKQTNKNSTIEFVIDQNDAEPITHYGITDKKKEATIYQKAGIHITADKPVIVYVIIQNGTVTEGFMALPTSTLGTEYITMAYNEPDMNTPGWFSPFTTITATENNTSVKFTMGGDESVSSEIAMNSGATLKNGESIERIMNKGDVWVFSINGKGQDLSGSLIEATKPVAVVSGVNCAQIPQGNTPCNYIVEMEMPTNIYGKRYFITPNKDRVYNGIVRVYSAEANATIYRNGSQIGNISEKGEYLEFRLWDKNDSNEEPNPPKVAAISSNKYIAVVYYNPGSQEDYFIDNSIIDNAYMMQIMPAEQFSNIAYVSSPNAVATNKPFNNNKLLITYESEGGSVPADLELSKLDLDNGVTEWKKVKDLVDNSNSFEGNYNGKHIGSVTLDISIEGSYVLKSESHKFSVQSISGLGNYSPYGFPSGGRFSSNQDNDHTPPTISYRLSCDGEVASSGYGIFDYDNNYKRTTNLKYYEFRNLDNYELEILHSSKDSVSWTLSRIDDELPASAEIYMIDEFGNDTTEQINYNLFEYSYTNENGYTNNPNFSKRIFRDTIRNLSADNDLYIVQTYYNTPNSGFEVIGYEPETWRYGDSIPPLGELVIISEFKNENIENGIEYNDSLYVAFGLFVKTAPEGCKGKPIFIKKFDVEYPKYKLQSGNEIEDIENDNAKIRIQDTLFNLSNKYPLYITEIALKYGDKGFEFDRVIPNSWAIGDSIPPNESIIVEMIYDPSHTLQTDEEQIVIDSLGIEVSAFGNEGVLEPIAFTYLTEQKAEIKAKTESSIKYEDSKYDIIINKNQLILDGDIYKNNVKSLNIYDIEGNIIVEFIDDSDNIYELQEIANGTYFVVIEINKEKIVKKIILTN